jgi:KTSC domain
MEKIAVAGLVPVQSTNIAAVGYDAGTLVVQFRDQSIYHYEDLPEQVYQGLLGAESKGRYLHRDVRGRYCYQRKEESAARQ